jgi:hypothetical protein
MSWMECLESGKVKKKTKDEEKATSLLEMAKNRWAHAEQSKLSKNDASIIVEEHYEALLQLIEGLMSKEGLKSDDHECAIFFLGEFYDEFFDDEEVDFLQRLRKARNKSRYEGQNMDISVAEEYISRSKHIFEKLKKLFS